jgi:mannose-1-phosphate guanylyltransferase/mannose-6-phosphate isomerase
MQIVPVILAGGEGRRLAPLSTPERPKAFLPLASGRTMLEETLLRFKNSAYTKPLIVLNHRHIDCIKNYDAVVLAQAEAKGTAFAIALASLYVQHENAKALMLVCPCDHAIEDISKFHSAVEMGQTYASEHHVLLGISPNAPNTGFGYIRKGVEMEAGVFKVQGFTEKPDLETAQAYVHSGAYFWNAGIFLLSPTLILQDIERCTPDIYSSALQSWGARKKVEKICYLGYAQDCPKTSIDTAVFEKSEKSVVVRLDTGWRDLGTPEALAEFLA